MSRQIKRWIEAGSTNQMFGARNIAQNIFQEVDFFYEAPSRDMFGSCYTLMLSADIPKKYENDVVCIFPNCRNPKKRFLEAKNYRSLSSMNIDINAIIGDSLENTAAGGAVKFAVAFGEHVFIAKSIVGTVYIVWATYVQRTNPGNVANTVATNWPFIMNFDGHMRPKGFFMLKTKISDPDNDLRLMPIAFKNPQLIYPKAPIFVCEVREEAQESRAITTTTKRAALAMATATTKDASTWVHHQENVFATEAGDAVQNGEQLFVEDDEVSWSNSPRDIFEGSVAATGAAHSLKTRAITRRLSFVREATAVKVHSLPPTYGSSVDNEEPESDPFEDAEVDQQPAPVAAIADEIEIIKL